MKLTSPERNSEKAIALEPVLGMAVTIMAGLSFGSVLTMFLVPTLYGMP